MLMYLLIFLIGISFGSFLNVVIYRLPQELSIITPRSFCPVCKHTLRWFHNIPLFSFIFLKAQCGFCKTKISLRYPLIELMTGLLAVFLFYKFGLSLYFLSSFIFTLILISLIFIDLDYQLLPDDLTLLLLWLGLIASLFNLFTNSYQAILGAVIGYMSLWSIAKSYEFIRKEEGMGYGDFKLLAALGAWTGWQQLLNIILISSITAAIIGLFLILFKKAHSRTAIPFGPFLAIGGWTALIVKLPPLWIH